MDAEKFAKWRACGFISHVEVSGPGDPCPCVVAAAQEGILYPLDQPPTLPFPGCERSPCCGCVYLPVLDDEAGDHAMRVADR